MSEFFDAMLDQSEVKSEIVAKYFDAWATVMNRRARSDRLAYIDLFAGPGRYLDGSKSTPVKVLEYCISKPELSGKMVTIFNDANASYADNLSHSIGQIPRIESMRYKPVVRCSAVGDELVSFFEKTRLIPTLAFVDPWGYKGLSSKLIAALIKDWGSDCIFFFNYNRINAGINNPKVVEHMNSIFGIERAEEMRTRLAGLPPEDRELIILNELAESLSSERQNFVLPFRFMRPEGIRTSHYLILVSKHVLGYTIMKNIMWKYSTDYNDGVASFSYIPVGPRQLSLLSQFQQPIETLGEQLKAQFRGQTLTLEQIHDMHHVGTQFVMINYQEALRRMEYSGEITVDPPAARRPKRDGVVTFSKKTKVTF